MSGLVEYPLKLRKGATALDDVWVFLRLPSDFSRADADRLGQWLATLAVEETDMQKQNEKPEHPITEPPNLERPDRPDTNPPGTNPPDRPGVPRPEHPIAEPEPPDRPKPKR